MSKLLNLNQGGGLNDDEFVSKRELKPKVLAVIYKNCLTWFFINLDHKDFSSNLHSGGVLVDRKMHQRA